MFFFTKNALAIGIGITPSEFSYPIATKNIVYESEFAISNTGEEDGYFNYSIEEPYSEWFSLYSEGNKLEAPFYLKSKESKIITAELLIPDDAAKGTYNVNIEFSTESNPDISSDEEGKATSHPVMKISAQYNITVTGDQILQGIMKKIEVPETEVNAPLCLKMTFENTGNVQAHPQYTGTIKQGNETIDSFEGLTDYIKPGKEEELNVLENVPLEKGEYVLDISTSLNGTLLKSESIPFEVLAEGSLEKSANLKELRLDNEPEKDSLLKVVAVVENDGKADFSGKFAGEVYINDKMTDLVESEDVYIPVGDTKELSFYYTPTSDGSYEIKGCVKYAGKETDSQNVSFKIGGSAPGFGAIMTFFFLIIACFMRRKK